MTPVISLETRKQYFYYGQDETQDKSKDLKIGSVEIRVMFTDPRTDNESHYNNFSRIFLSVEVFFS